MFWDAIRERWFDNLGPGGSVGRTLVVRYTVLAMDFKSSLLLILACLLIPAQLQPQEDDDTSAVDESAAWPEVSETTTDGWGWNDETEPTEPTTEQETTTFDEYSTTTEEGDGETFSVFDFFSSSSNDEEKAPKEKEKEAAIAEQRVVKLSEQIRNVLASYREHGVITLPGLPIPDPMPVPDFKKNFATSPINFTNNTVYGLSNFTVDHINTDIDKMQVFVALHINRLVILGNYSTKSWLSNAAGAYNVTLLDVEASGAAEIERDDEGNFQATNSEMDMTFTRAKVELQNIGAMRSFLQGIIASAGPALFDAIKPSILQEVNGKIREQVNAKIKGLGDKITIPSDDISPIDKAISEGRRYVRENGYDPYKMDEKTLEVSPVKVSVSEFVIAGLSRFYRVGDIGLSMDKGNIQASIHLATKRLFGSCKWNVSFSDFFNRNGVSDFTIKQLQIRAKVNQSLDVKQPPKLVDLDIFLGPIRLQMDKSENFNFIIEFLVNTMPALIRHVIVDTLEIPIKIKVQEILDKVDMEQILEDTLPELDNMGL